MEYVSHPRGGTCRVQCRWNTREHARRNTQGFRNRFQACSQLSSWVRKCTKCNNKGILFIYTYSGTQKTQFRVKLIEIRIRRIHWGLVWVEAERGHVGVISRVGIVLIRWGWRRGASSSRYVCVRPVVHVGVWSCTRKVEAQVSDGSKR